MENLIDITMSDDTERVYMVGLDVNRDSLAEKEVEALDHSAEYLKEKEIKQNKLLVESAWKDFYLLSKIEDMPIEALEIISKWTYVAELDDVD